MLLWIAFALLTAAVLATVLAPLGRPSGSEEGEGSAEAGTLAVYRDQLAEIDAERARGLIGAAEAEAARLEVSRRLLKSAAGHAEPQAGGAVPQPPHARIALVTAVAVPLLALGLYLAHGSPGMPSSPFAARDEATLEQAKLARMIAEVEARLSTVPAGRQGLGGGRARLPEARPLPRGRQRLRQRRAPAGRDGRAAGRACDSLRSRQRRHRHRGGPHGLREGS